MKRNKAANCGNCPMWYKSEQNYGQCRNTLPAWSESGHNDCWPLTHRSGYCVQHPDFAAPEPSDMPAPMAERVELIDALEKANAELANLRAKLADALVEAIDLRQKVGKEDEWRDQLAAKVRGLFNYDPHGKVTLVAKEAVLALLED
jgi:hypothetical protein